MHHDSIIHHMGVGERQVLPLLDHPGLYTINDRRPSHLCHFLRAPLSEPMTPEALSRRCRTQRQHPTVQYIAIISIFLS